LVINQMMTNRLLLLVFIATVQTICYERSVLFPHKTATGSQLFELKPQDDVS
jgi:hypothetical protein